MEIVVSIMLYIFSFALFRFYKAMIKPDPEYIYHTKCKISSVDQTANGTQIFVKFINENNEVVQGESNIFTSSKIFHLGDEIEVDYYYFDNEMKSLFNSHDRTASIRINDAEVVEHALYSSKTIPLIVLALSVMLFVFATYILLGLFI